jgi:hypothetical protein
MGTDLAEWCLRERRACMNEGSGPGYMISLGTEPAPGPMGGHREVYVWRGPNFRP